MAFLDFASGGDDQTVLDWVVAVAASGVGLACMVESGGFEEDAGFAFAHSESGGPVS